MLPKVVIGNVYVKLVPIWLLPVEAKAKAVWWSLISVVVVPVRPGCIQAEAWQRHVVKIGKRPEARRGNNASSAGVVTERSSHSNGSNKRCEQRQRKKQYMNYFEI